MNNPFKENDPTNGGSSNGKRTYHTKTPPAKKKKTGNKASATKKPSAIKWWVFEMKDEVQDGPVIFQDGRHASDFRKDNKVLIAQERRFKTDKNFFQYKNQKSIIDGSTKTPGTPTDKTYVNRIDTSSAEKLMKECKKVMPCNAVHGTYHTTKTSPLCILTVEFRDASGKQVWCIKPEFVATILQSFSKVLPHETKVVQEAMANAVTMRMRDPKGDKNQQARTEPKTRKDGSTGQGFEIFLMVTHFSIPYGNFSNVKEEGDWLNDTVNLILAHILLLMQTKTFIDAVELHSGGTKFFQFIMSKNAKYITYTEYLKNAAIRVAPMENDFELLVADDAAELARMHYKKRLITRKYVLRAIGATGDDETDEDNDDEHGVVTYDEDESDDVDVVVQEEAEDEDDDDDENVNDTRDPIGDKPDGENSDDEDSDDEKNIMDLKKGRNV